MPTPGEIPHWDDPLLHWDDPRFRWDTPWPAPPNMINNRISAVFSDADKTEVLTALGTIDTKMPFLQPLTPEERQKLPHASADRLPFLDQVAIAIAQQPDYLPPKFDPVEFNKDLALLKQIAPVLAALESKLEKVRDTYTLASFEAYAQGLDVYRYFKAANRDGSLDAYVDLLGQVFARRTTPPATPKPPTTPITPHA